MRQEIRTVRHALDRLVLPQCTIGRVGVGIKFRRQFFDVEIFRQISRACVHAAILFRSDRYAVFTVSHATNPATVPPRNTASLTRLEMKMHARADAPAENVQSWPE